MGIQILKAGRRTSTLRVERGFVVIDDDLGEVGRAPIENLVAVISTNRRTALTHAFLNALALKGIPFVLCNENYFPVSILWPLDTHFRQAKVMSAQAGLSEPKRKQLWQQIVKRKIQMQAAVLAELELPDRAVAECARRVMSGDTTNMEGVSAALYWPLLFGDGFRRDRDNADENAGLNYGYTILRAAVARATAAAGLHPTLGLHHSNRGNAFCLVDDLIEPFRPLVDALTWRMRWEGSDFSRLDGPMKKRYVSLLWHRIETREGSSSLISMVNNLATSLAAKVLGERQSITLPEISSIRSVL